MLGVVMSDPAHSLMQSAGRRLGRGQRRLGRSLDARSGDKRRAAPNSGIGSSSPDSRPAGRAVSVKRCHTQRSRPAL
jgi:hypothetical protein